MHAGRSRTPDTICDPPLLIRSVLELFRYPCPDLKASIPSPQQRWANLRNGAHWDKFTVSWVQYPSCCQQQLTMDRFLGTTPSLIHPVSRYPPFGPCDDTHKGTRPRGPRGRVERNGRRADRMTLSPSAQARLMIKYGNAGYNGVPRAICSILGIQDYQRHHDVLHRSERVAWWSTEDHRVLVCVGARTYSLKIFS